MNPGKSPLGYKVTHHPNGIDRLQAGTMGVDTAHTVVVVTDASVATWGPDGKPIDAATLWEYWSDLAEHMAEQLKPGLRLSVLLGVLPQIATVGKREAAAEAPGQLSPKVVLECVEQELGAEARRKVEDAVCAHMHPRPRAV